MHSKTSRGLGFGKNVRSALLAEPLEQRVLLTSVHLEGETLQIVGDSAGESVSVYEATTDDFTVVSIDSDRNGSFTDPGDLVTRYQGVKAYDIRLLGGDDDLAIVLWHPTSKQISIDLGDGDDLLDLTAGWHINYNVADGYRGHMPTMTASLDVSVTGGAGNDVANISYDRLQGGSQLNLKLDMGDGDDQVAFRYSQSIATLLADIGLGDGNDSCRFKLVLYREPGGRAQTDIGTATVNMYGGEGKDAIYAHTIAGEPDYYGIAHPNLSLGLFGGAGENRLGTYLDYKIRPASVTDDIEFQGTTGDDQILISAGNQRYPDGVYPVRVTINGLAREVFVPSGVVRVRGLAGNDTITADQWMPFDVNVYGGEGDDRITGSRRASLYGGLGNDFLIGQTGNDLIEGGEGADTIIGNDGNDTLYGHDGNDSIDAGTGADELYGNGGSDTLAGGDGNDYLAGHDGNDSIDAGTGDDKLYGNGGSDTLAGGDGNDSLFGHDGDDSIDAGAGADELYGNGGSDTLAGGAGNDYLYGNDGNDLIDAGAGNDHLFGFVGNDTLAGGDGNDYLSGDDGDDSMLGGRGDDTLYGNFGADTLSGGSGNDQMYGGLAPDLLKGDDGDDTLLGGDGTDLIYGGPGADRIEGKGKADTLHGGMGNDTIISGAGSDVILGEDGDDTLDANPNILFCDTIKGGAGRDLYIADEDDVLMEVEEVLA